MPFITKDIVDHVLIPFTLRCFFVGGVLSLILGASLIFCNTRTLQYMERMNRWISFRKEFKPLAIPRDSWPSMQRNRYWFAIVLVAGSAFALFGLTLKFNAVAAISLLLTVAPWVHSAGSWIVEGVRWFLIVGSATGVIVGLMLYFFPEQLAALEKRASRWHSFREVSKGGDRMHFMLDRWVEAFPRIAGWIIAASGIVILINVTPKLL